MNQSTESPGTLKAGENEMENAVQAAARLLVRAGMEQLYHDSHQWSRRPCGTCRSITRLLGEDFGCIRYAKEHPNGR